MDMEKHKDGYKEHWAEQRQKKNSDMGRGQRLLNKGQGWG